MTSRIKAQSRTVEEQLLIMMPANGSEMVDMACCSITMPVKELQNT
jgi:hypothetical protein